MKRLSLIIILAVLFTACKNETKTEYQDENLEVTTSIYPEAITKVFDAHGGIDSWNQFNGLQFGIQREDLVEKHEVNLKNRQSLIKYKHHHLGFDGEQVWLKNLDTTTYKSNPKFYYNLMFYFYAMPFIVGDNGINYEEGPELEVDGKTYPGILISYEAGVGESPEDEYVIYYDEETNRMEWLAYTVTFFSKEKGKKFNLIKYADWQSSDGLLMPTKLQWHKFEEGEVGEMRNEMVFINAAFSKDSPNTNLFVVPEGATIAE